jgi:hypothetical protein
VRKFIPWSPISTKPLVISIWYYLRAAFFYPTTNKTLLLCESTATPSTWCPLHSFSCSCDDTHRTHSETSKQPERLENWG